MKKRALVLFFVLFLCCSNQTVYASDIDNMNINPETVVYVGDSHLSLREEPNSSSTELGILKTNSSAYKTGKKSGDWIEVISSDTKGWVYEPLTVSGDDLNSYIKKNLSVFKVKAHVKSTTGTYSSVNNLKNDTLSYLTKVSFKKDNVKLYKTSSLSSEIYDENSYISTVKVKEELVKIRKEPSKKAICLRYADKDAEYEVLGKKKSWYKVKTSEGLTGYIKDTYCEEYIRHPLINNIADVKYTKNTMYDALEMGSGIIKVIINGTEYYTSEDDVYIFYMSGKTSTAHAIVSKDSVFDLCAIGTKNNVYKVKDVNTFTGTDIDVYLNASDAELVVDFSEANIYEIEREDEDDSESANNARDAHKGINFIPKETKSKYKDRYEYEYANDSTEERNEIVNYALSFLGNPYLYGGTSLEHGIDCSAYCQKILQHFGKKIGRCTADQVSESYGKVINAEDIQPGDLIYYSHDGVHPYHVVMYLGGDKCVNASCRRWGICISTIEKDNILMIKNYID